MSVYVDRFIKQHKEYFNRNKIFVESNSWDDSISYNSSIESLTEGLVKLYNKKKKTPKIEKDISDIKKEIASIGTDNQKGKSDLFKQETSLTGSIVGRLEAFIKATEKSGDRNLTKVQKFIDFTADIINIHINKCEVYLDYNMDVLKENSDEEYKIDIRGQEIAFQDQVFKKKIEIQDTLERLNIDNNVNQFSIEFFKNQKAAIPMISILPHHNQDIADITERLDLPTEIGNKEFLIHMDKSTIPRWNEKKHYWEQDRDTLLFWWNEWLKISDGFEVDGFVFHPWLYYHLNYFKTYIPINAKDVLSTPPLRDNEWYIAELLKEAERKKNVGILLYGSRRISKSTNMASICEWKALIMDGISTAITSGSDGDLAELTHKIKTSMKYKVPAFQLPLQKQEWAGGTVELGLKVDQQTLIEHSRHTIKNLNSGAKSASQKTAGGAPSVFLLEEIGKFSWKAAYTAAQPSFETDDGFKTTVILVGCVCAGTKVWDNNGNLLNIEDLVPERGILGYNQETKSLSKEEITYWQAPHEKPCYRIETNQGRVLECSEDHPILARDKWNCGTFKKTQSFIETKDLQVGDSITVIEEVNIWSKKEMYEPRLMGWLIGDGSYGNGQTTSLMNADPEMLEYVKNKYHTNVYFEAKTKDGRSLEKMGINGLTPYTREIGIYGQTKDNKRLPINFHSYSKYSVTELIGGYFDADGCAYVNEKTGEVFMKLTSANCEIIQEVKLILQKLGIHGNVMYEKPNFNNPKTTRGHYNLIVKDKKSILKFAKEINFSITYKQQKLNRAVEILNKKKGKFVKGEKTVRFEKIKSITFIGEKPVYNLTAGTTNTYIANGIITHNTGGEASLSKDAMDALANPSSYKLMEMNWDLLESKIPKGAITWKRRTFANFIPAQMAIKTGFKRLERGFGDFLGIDSKELNKVKIFQTDWVTNTKVLREDRRKVAKDRFLSQQEAVQYPLDPEECFLSAEENPFPGMEAKKHKDYLESIGDTGRKVDLYRDNNGKVCYDQASKKEDPTFPYAGGYHDSPVTIYEDPPETPDVNSNLYIAGLDDYKHESSDGDSLGSMVIFKRNIMDEWSDRIVASYHSRPDPHSDFHKNCHMLLELYGARCFPENEDMDFKQYLDKKFLSEKYLLKGFSFLAEFNLNTNNNREYGWQPTTKNKKSLLGRLRTYTREEEDIKDSDGEIVKTILGVQKIPDVKLLEELTNYKAGENFDGITSFMSALGYSYYLDSTYQTPDIRPKNVERKLVNNISRPFGGKRYKPF
jgi:hypothetical protein